MLLPLGVVPSYRGMGRTGWHGRVGLPYMAPTLGDEIAGRVRELRTERRLSQAQLAEAMAELGFGWSRMTVTEVEGARRRAVSVEELLGLAYVLDVGVKRLLGVNVRKPPTDRGANLVEVTDQWLVDRFDVWALIDAGRRSSRQEEELRQRRSVLLGELAAEKEALSVAAKHAEAIAHEVARVEEELRAAQAQNTPAQRKGK